MDFLRIRYLYALFRIPFHIQIGRISEMKNILLNFLKILIVLVTTHIPENHRFIKYSQE